MLSRRPSDHAFSVRLFSRCIVAAPPLAAALAVGACTEETKPPPPAPAPSVTSAAISTPAPSARPASTPAPTSAACVASPAWITNPTMPAEVASAETFCDFYQFSWQWFLAQVSPSKVPGERIFETNRVYQPSGGTGQCQKKALTGRAAAIKALFLRGPKAKDFEDTQADGHVLYDQNQNILYASIWYSSAECQSTSAGFAPGTMELKVAWKILAQPDPTYFTIQAALPSGAASKAGDRNVTLGLVGFHMVNWTSKHPEMIWATFEHKTNAPLCNGTSRGAGWSFTSADAAQCLAKNTQPGSGPPPTACSQFAFNTPPNVKNPPPTTGTPVQVCRQYENGNQPGASINGNDNAANALAIRQLNEELVGPKGLLTRLADTDPMAVWKNYEMVGGLWTKNGAASGKPPVTSGKGPGDPSSPQRGSLELTNMTMETFQQGDTSFVPNCFGCHGFTPTAPITVSHIASNLFSFSVSNKAKK